MHGLGMSTQWSWGAEVVSFFIACCLHASQMCNIARPDDGGREMATGAREAEQLMMIPQ